MKCNSTWGNGFHDESLSSVCSFFTHKSEARSENLYFIKLLLVRVLDMKFSIIVKKLLADQSIENLITNALEPFTYDVKHRRSFFCSFSVGCPQYRKLIWSPSISMTLLGFILGKSRRGSKNRFSHGSRCQIKYCKSDVECFSPLDSSALKLSQLNWLQISFLITDIVLCWEELNWIIKSEVYPLSPSLNCTRGCRFSHQCERN